MTTIHPSDYDRSVRMMGTHMWLKRAEEQMNDPERRAIIMSFPTSRAQAEVALSFVAAESIPYEAKVPAPYWNMGMGNVLYCLEQAISRDGSAVNAFEQMEVEKARFYRATGLGQ